MMAYFQAFVSESQESTSLYIDICIIIYLIYHDFIQIFKYLLV